jgi:hypothetical protein
LNNTTAPSGAVLSSDMKKSIYFPFHGKVGEMTEVESALDDLEPSWADFAYAIRPDGMGRPSRRVPGVLSEKTQGLATVHALLEGYHDQYKAGERIGIFHALTTCAEENVPLPYWLATAILDIRKDVSAEPRKGELPKSLHDLFGLGQLLPLTRTKGMKARRDIQLQGRIWAATRTIMAERGTRLVDAALEEARRKLAFPYSQRKAREMFDKQQAIQTRHSNIVGGRKGNRLR